MKSKKGIDVSVWNGEIDWNRVKADGVEFAILRVGSAVNLDRRFTQNITGAFAAGVPCGAYLYSYAQTPPQALAEAKFALAALAPHRLAYPLFYDIEDKVQHDMTIGERTALVKTFCDAVGAAGMKTGVYTSLSWFHTMLDLDALRGYDKWVAQWAPVCTLRVPFTIWQNSNIGKISGISGDVDMNIAYMDYGAATPNIPSAVHVPLVKAPYTKGAKLLLRQTALYASAAALSRVTSVSGSYWVYDGRVANGRIRITNSAQRVGKLPVGQNVTGYINTRDISRVAV